MHGILKIDVDCHNLQIYLFSMKSWHKTTQLLFLETEYKTKNYNNCDDDDVGDDHGGGGSVVELHSGGGVGGDEDGDYDDIDNDGGDVDDDIRSNGRVCCSYLCCIEFGASLSTK